MRVDWSLMVTIFLAPVLARLFTRSLFSNSEASNISTQVGAEVNSPAEAKIVYISKLDQYIDEKYPNARR